VVLVVVFDCCSFHWVCYLFAVFSSPDKPLFLYQKRKKERRKKKKE